MVEPTRRNSRLALAGGMLAAVALVGTGFLLGRSTADAPEPVTTPSPAPAPQPSPSPTSTPIAKAPLGRAELIATAAQAADAYASGQPQAAEVAALAGRRVELDLAFGCDGPSTVVNTPLGWRYDQEAQTLRVRVLPVLWEAAAWAPVEAAARIDSIEGFWVPRPWTASDGCPATGPALPGASDVPDERTLGIAQYHLAGGSRLGRRDGEAYEAVRKVAPNALDLTQGLRLRLRGEVTSAPGGGPIVCRALAGGQRRPVCLVSVSLAEVAILNPATNATLATWDVSRGGEPGG